jgi:hypothetical protein
MLPGLSQFFSLVRCSWTFNPANERPLLRVLLPGTRGCNRRLVFSALLGRWLSCQIAKSHTSLILDVFQSLHVLIHCTAIVGIMQRDKMLARPQSFHRPANSGSSSSATNLLHREEDGEVSDPIHTKRFACPFSKHDPDRYIDVDGACTKRFGFLELKKVKYATNLLYSIQAYSV